MLSPGEWHKVVPREPVENVRFRLDVYRHCREDTGFRRAIVWMCGRDILLWVNLFVWQFNPDREGDEFGPFATWDFQDKVFLDLLRAVEERRDVLIEKSREMGASWMCLIAMVWLWLFHGWKKFLCMSRSEEAVESADPDSLFWKIDFILDHMPAFLLPTNWSGGPPWRKKRYLGNVDNGSTITGTASTGKAGVGGRATAMFIDEFSQIDEGKEVLHRTSDTTRCRIFNGTHLGLDTAFYELSVRPDMRKLVLHWTMHPDKRKGLYRYDESTGKVEILDRGYRYPVDFDFVLSPEPLGGPYPGLRSPWYDEQCKRKGSPRAVAMDLDINPQGTVSQFFNPLLIRTLLAYCRAPSWRGRLLYRKEGAAPVRFLGEHELTQLEPELAYSPLIELWLTPDIDGRVPLDRYTLGADISHGTGATPSCCAGIRCSTGEKFLEMVDPNVDPGDFALAVVALARFLESAEAGPARLIWEQQGPGIKFGKVVLELGFWNIYYRDTEIPTKMVREFSDRPGWVNAPDSKRLLLTEYQEALKLRKLANYSKPALEECLKFKFTDDGRSVVHQGELSPDDPSGARVNHGDRTMADALAWKLAAELGTGRPKKKEDDGPPLLSLAWRRKFHEERARREDSA
jgi:hypothetical protein